MIADQPPGDPRAEPSASREALRFWALLVGFVAASLILAALPVLLTIWLHPWISTVVAAAFLWAWVKLVHTRPGLAQGTLALGGAALILGSLLGCLVLALRHVLA